MRRFVLWPMLAVLLAAALGRTAPASVAQTPSMTPNSGDDFVVVQLAGGVSAQALSADDKVPTLEDLGYRRVPVPPGKTREQFVAELKSLAGVISAEPDVPVTAAATPNDPYYQRYQAQYLEQIGLPSAWDLSTGSNSIIVAVLDSGLDHPDFAGRLWENTADGFNDGVDHDNNGCVNDRYGCRYIDLTTSNMNACGYKEGSSTLNGNVLDDNPGSHGTFVSGIIGAAGDNNLGVTGVAWNVRIMPVKVLDCGTGPNGGAMGKMFSVAEGILYAARMGANIINLSLSQQEQLADTSTLRSAIQVAQTRGIIVVAAAGNYGSLPQPGPGYPGAYTEFPNLITVGASNHLAGNTWAPFSAYGPAIDFAAPGGRNISSTVRTDSGFASGPYGQDDLGGTSFAAPLVSGMFALMMSRNSHLAAAEYIQIAREAATPATPAPHGQNWAGAGIINIGAAVARVPMTLDGDALRDWRDVAPGTEVRATVDGNDCGVTTTFAIGRDARYLLRVKSTAEQPGCGAPGKAVQVSVGAAAARGPINWGGRNENLGLLRDVVTVSPSPGAVVVETLNGGWSNIAHFEASGSLPGALSAVPTPWSAIYKWDPERPSAEGSVGSFLRFLRSAPAFASDLNSIQTYDTYWVNAQGTPIASLNPNPPPGRVLQLKPGWNNFVYTGTSNAVADALAEVAGKYTEVLQYDNASSSWLVYIPNQHRLLQDFGGLFKLKVYWIYMTQAGAITMN